MASEDNLNKTKFYLRYVDGILAAFHNKQDSLNFLEFLNNRHRNVKFTIEKQINHSIFFVYSFQVSIIKISLFKHITKHDIENIKSNLIKNAYPPFLIDKVIKKYLDYKFSTNQNQLKDKSDVHYFKLTYIGNPSHHIKNKLSKLCKEFSKENFNILLVLLLPKLKIIFYIKTQFLMKSFLGYKFTCASCSSGYIAETCHFKARIEEHIKKDNTSHISYH